MLLNPNVLVQIKITVIDTSPEQETPEVFVQESLVELDETDQTTLEETQEEIIIEEEVEVTNIVQDSPSAVLEDQALDPDESKVFSSIDFGILYAADYKSLDNLITK